MEHVKRVLSDIDVQLSRSTFGRVFHLEGSGHHDERKGAKFWREIQAGLTTFFTMAYIISVNASMVAQTGGPCLCDTDPHGPDPHCFSNAAYDACKTDVQRDLITATAAIAGLSTFVFGFLTNLPVALAPGMGLNAYFTYQVVGINGTGPVPYRLALTAVFVEGFIFVFLSLIGVRQWLVKIIPESVKIASGVGIGLFLTAVGFSYSGGIGIITGGPGTPLSIAGCPYKYISPETGTCKGHYLENPAMWVGITCGGFLSAYLMAYRVKLAIIIGIAVVSIMSWPRSTEFTYFDYGPEGSRRFEFFKKVIAFHPIHSTLAVQDWDVSSAGQHFALALFTFLYVDIVDCTATLYSMARFAGVIDDNGDFPRSTIAFCTDAICISMGSLLGVSPVTVFVESGAGITQGGKTGLTAMTTGTCFMISIFFAPIFASIPPWATGCTLVLVGCMMMRQVVQINWHFLGDTLPAFVTIAFMPLSYSVAYGLIAGLLTYAVINGGIYLTTKLSRGRIQPVDHEEAQYWNWKGRGKLPWFMRVVVNGTTFWRKKQSTRGSKVAKERELRKLSPIPKPRSKQVEKSGMKGSPLRTEIKFADTCAAK